MKKITFVLFLLFSMLSATVKAQTNLNIDYKKSIDLSAAQGETVEFDLKAFLVENGIDVSDVYYFVQSPCSLSTYAPGDQYHPGPNTSYYTFEFPSNAKINITEGETVVDDIVFDGTLDQNSNVESLIMRSKGQTYLFSYDTFLCIDKSDANSAKLTAIPVHIETYNSFQYFKSKMVTNLDDIADKNKSFVIKKEVSNNNFSTYFNEKSFTPIVITPDNNNEVTETLKGRAFSVESNRANVGTKYCIKKIGDKYVLCDEYGYYPTAEVYDNNTNISVSFGVNNSASSDKVFEVKHIKTDTFAIVSEGTYGNGKVYTELVYNETEYCYDYLITVVPGSGSFDTNALNKHLLFAVELTEDETPHFKPYNGQKTSVLGGQAGTEFENATNPFRIEMTFDRPLKVDNSVLVDGKPQIVDINGVPLKDSPLFKITVDDGTSWWEASDGSSSAPAYQVIDSDTKKYAPFKKPRTVLVNTTNLLPGTDNVAIVELNQTFFNTTTVDMAPVITRLNGPRKKPRTVLVNTTNIMVNAQNGAIAYSDVSDAEVAEYISSGGVNRAPSYSGEVATSPFAFEYTIEADDQNDAVKEEILNGTKVDITIGNNGISTFCANGYSIVPNTTEQLKFYCVTKLGDGKIHLTRVTNYACGPMLVTGKPGRTVSVERMSYARPLDKNYLMYCKPGGYITYYYSGYKPNSYSDEEYSEYPTSSPFVAYNYLFGRYNNGPLGFYHFKLNEDTNYTNDRGFGFVYLQSYKNLSQSASSDAPVVTFVIDDGKETTEMTTPILSIVTNTQKADNTKRYNAMGQAVNSEY